MKKIILKVVIASALLSSWTAVAASHDCKNVPADTISVAKRYVPAISKLHAADAQTLLMIAGQQTPGGIAIPKAGNDRDAFLIAGWLTDKTNIFAALEVVRAAHSGSSTMHYAAEALDTAYSPISDNDEEKSTLAQDLGELYQKRLAAHAALGPLAREPGMDLFINALIYQEPISEKIALDLMCHAADPEIFDKAEKIRRRMK